MSFKLHSSSSEEEKEIIKQIHKNKHNIKQYQIKANLKQKENTEEKALLLNKLIEYNTRAQKENRNKNIDEENLDEIDSLILEDKLNYYEVKKQNIINYMTPIKVNNTKYGKNKEKNKVKNKNFEIIYDNDNDKKEELSNLFSNSSTDDKKVMVSELDIQLSHSDSNYYTDYKNKNSNHKTNNINMIKKREIDFKKEIEENLEKFLKNNQEKMNSNININTNTKQNTQYNTINTSSINSNNEKNLQFKDKTKSKLKFFKKNKNNKFICCFTENDNKNTKYNTNIKNKGNKISSFIVVKNRFNFDKTCNSNSNLNNSFKNNIELNNRNNLLKNFNDIIKINISKRINKINNKIITKMNKKANVKTINNNQNKRPMIKNIYDIKSKIFYLQNKNKNLKNIFNNKKNEKNEHFILNRKYNKKKSLTNYILNNFNINTNPNEYFGDSEKKPNKNEYNSLTNNRNSKDKIKLNLNDKNIIIQNFNHIDYNNINININNNVIKPIRQQKKRNTVYENLSNKKNNSSLSNINNFSNFKKVLNNNNQTKYLCDRCIKNSNKNANTSLNNSKFFFDKKNIFLRKHNEKKLTYKENPDIKNKILNYYLNKKDFGNLTNNNCKKRDKYIKVNDNIEYNTINTMSNISNNRINKETIFSKKKELKSKINKQKTYKKIERYNFSNNIFASGKNKFIRQRKEKRNTQVCSNNIKKNLIKYKFINLK